MSYIVTCAPVPVINRCNMKQVVRRCRMAIRNPRGDPRRRSVQRRFRNGVPNRRPGESPGSASLVSWRFGMAIWGFRVAMIRICAAGRRALVTAAVNIKTRARIIYIMNGGDSEFPRRCSARRAGSFVVGRWKYTALPV